MLGSRHTVLLYVSVKVAAGKQRHHGLTAVLYPNQTHRSGHMTGQKGVCLLSADARTLIGAICLEAWEGLKSWRMSGAHVFFRHPFQITTRKSARHTGPCLVLKQASTSSTHY